MRMRMRHVAGFKDQELKGSSRRIWYILEALVGLEVVEVVVLVIVVVGSRVVVEEGEKEEGEEEREEEVRLHPRLRP